MHSAQLAALLAFSCFALLAAAGRLQFLREELPDRPRRLLAAALLFGILTVCVFYPALSSEQADIDPSSLQFPALFLGHALLSAFLLAWWRLRSDVSLAHLLHLRPLIIADLRRGVWLGCLGWVAMILITAAVALLLRGTGLPEPASEVPPFMFWFAHLALWRKLVVIAVAMTVEEAFFRGFLQPRIGWLPSTALFVLGHASYGLPLMLVGVTVISLIIGWSFRQTHRLLPSVVAHGTFDAIQLLIVIPLAVRTIEHDTLRVLAGF